MARLGFLFPGQGAQTVGMAKTLTDEHPVAKALFRQAAEILGYDLLAVCVDGPAERLNATDISQPAIYVASLAALEVLKASDPDLVSQCVATAGLSLGEYTALAFAGALDFADGLRLVQKRGQAMQAAAEATPSGMVSVLLVDVPEVEKIVAEASKSGRIWIANYLCPGNTVVSGELAACRAVETIAEVRSGKAIALTVAGAFHTEIMMPADASLAEVLATTPFTKPRIPVWSNVDGESHEDPEQFRKLLVRQVVEPVRWEQCVRGLMQFGVERFYEIGPGKVLTGLLKRIDRKMECRSVPA